MIADQAASPSSRPGVVALDALQPYRAAVRGPGCWPRGLRFGMHAGCAR